MSEEQDQLADARRTLRWAGIIVLAIAAAFIAVFVTDDSQGAGLALVAAVVAAPLGIFILYLALRRPRH